MKKTICTIGALFMCFCLVAQDKKGVGIGVGVPNKSAMLHIESTNKGVLIPRVSLNDDTSTLSINALHPESLLVYNNADKGLDKGYYYWLIDANDKGKWVRVLTSNDQKEILSGQIQESFVEKKDNTGKPNGIYVYTPDKNDVNEANPVDQVVLDIPTLIQEYQSLTSFELKEFNMYYYSDNSIVRQEKPISEDYYLVKTEKELELIYKDEKGTENSFTVKDLLGANNTEVPAITNLDVDTSQGALLYTDDKGILKTIHMNELVKALETRTSLNVTPNGDLVYINEAGENDKFIFPLRSIVQEPWYNAATNQQAVSNKENIFTQGWVGIGIGADAASVALTALKPDEKLRVNGSIYARNSFYADYVFDNYFSGEASDLKSDYNFSDLAVVESYIKNNYHLPGVTPIHELDFDKSEGYLINVSELSIQLLEKVEELYLHTIEQRKVIDEQQALLNLQQEKTKTQDERLLKLESMFDKLSK